MRHSDNYELNLVEGSDIVNPLVQDVPNYEAIDAAMFDNKKHSVGVATELKTGTVHALTRQNEDASVFRFTATSDYTVGDTFEVDGVQVSALLVDGTTLPNRCYIIGSEVLASLKGTLLTVYANRTTASDSDKLGGHLPAYYATDTDLDNLEGVVDAHSDQISQLSSDLSEFSKMKSEVLGNASADWVQVGKVVTVYFGTLTTNAIFNNLPIPYERDSGALPIAMRQASDGTILSGFFGINGGKAYLECPTANLCYATLTYITV